MEQLVSIIIPCYNQGKFLDECIKSVLSQTYKNIEIIIVDDGSTDSYTKEKLNSIKNINDFIKVIIIENSGVCTARNIGIENSNGFYILPLDADDKISSTYIEKCMKIFLEKKDVDVVYSMTRLFGKKNKLFILDDYSEKRMLKSNVVVCTAMYRKLDFYKCGGYNTNMIYGYEDWDLWLSMIENRKNFYRINEALFYYRVKDVSRTTELSKNNKYKIMIQQIYENHRKLYLKYNYDIKQFYTDEKDKWSLQKIVNKIERLKINFLYYLGNYKEKI